MGSLDLFSSWFSGSVFCPPCWILVRFHMVGPSIWHSLSHEYPHKQPRLVSYLNITLSKYFIIMWTPPRLSHHEGWWSHGYYPLHCHPLRTIGLPPPAHLHGVAVAWATQGPFGTCTSIAGSLNSVASPAASIGATLITHHLPCMGS